VAITNVHVGLLPRKAARCDAIAKLYFFGTSRHRRLNFDPFVYIHFAAPPSAAGVIITANVYREWIKTSVLFLAFVDQSSQNVGTM